VSAHHDAGGALAGLLDSVDDAKLCQVIRVVEASGQRRTLEPAIADLRPRLRRLRPPRPLTLSRLLAIPLAPALELGAGTGAPFSIARERIGFWLARIIERLDPMLAATSRTAIVGHAVDDATAVVATGRRLWPAAARVLAAEAVPSENTAIEAERWRIVDLFDIAEQLVPQLVRLPPMLPPLDDVQRATVRAILALAEGGPVDRLGTLAALLLRRAGQPRALVDRLIDLAPPGLRPRLYDLLQRLLTEHRAGLVRRLASLEADPEPILADIIETLARLADTIADPGGAAPGRLLARSPCNPAPSCEIGQLRERAATLARAHYAAAIDQLLAPLAAAGDIDRSVIAVQEQTARQIARLGALARCLSPATSIHEITGAAIERLVDLGARHQGGDRPLVTVDDARLIEILAGPDLARRYLCLEALGRT